MRTDSQSLVDRLLGRGVDTQLEDGVDRLLIARILAYLFGSGALLMIVTLALDGDAQREPGALAAVGGIAFVAALVIVVVYDAIPMPALRLAPALGTALVTVSIYYAGPTASAAYALYYSWAVIAASMFFRTGVLVGHGAFVIACYLGVVIARDNPGNTAELQVAMVVGTVVAVSAVMTAITGELRTMLVRLDEAARTDHLTGLLNRRAFSETFENEVARASRTARPLGVVMLDLDGFKAYNDRHGHPTGDAALRRLSAVLTRTTRSIDHLARVGGEEFAILTPETGPAGTLAMAERLRRAIEIEFSERDLLTASFGVATYPENGSDVAQLFAAADAAMYEAKAAGRNRAVASRAKPEPRAPSPSAA